MKARPIVLTAAEVARFWSKVTVRPDGCWEWVGARTSTGYGVFRAGSVALGTRTLYRAHRVAYFLSNGEIPPRLVIDHRCRRRSCVRPSHLEATTQDVNVLRTYIDGGRCEYLNPYERSHYERLTDDELTQELAGLEVSA